VLIADSSSGVLTADANSWLLIADSMRGLRWLLAVVVDAYPNDNHDHNTATHGQHMVHAETGIILHGSWDCFRNRLFGQQDYGC
jgi:hypothetical protein